MPEELFWETMTPARLYSLLEAAFRPAARSAPPQSLQKGEKQEKKDSFFEFLTGRA